MKQIGPRLAFVNDADNGPSLIPRLNFIIDGSMDGNFPRL